MSKSFFCLSLQPQGKNHNKGTNFHAEIVTLIIKIRKNSKPTPKNLMAFQPFFIKKTALYFSIDY